jgi:hypothetical protein
MEWYKKAFSERRRLFKISLFNYYIAGLTFSKKICYTYNNNLKKDYTLLAFKVQI